MTFRGSDCATESAGGDVAFYTQAASSCQMSLISLFSTGGQLYEGILNCNNLFALLDLEPTEVEGALRGLDGAGKRWGDLPAPRAVAQGIEFRNVSFRYPGTEQWILRNINLHLHPGESVALVGPNGAGKTTLVKLLTRLYDPTEGEILLDGRDLREYDLDGLRKLFAVVFQDHLRFSLTLRENIGFGDVSHVEDLERVKRAAGRAGADDIADRLPKGYETYLARQFTGQGADLSGGEWQKVALARAYMRESPFLVLDEPTAALDAFAEHAFYKSVDEMSAGRTVLFISHRFSTVRMAKSILVLDRGELVEEGSHEALIARKGMYATMFETQAERYR